MLRTPAHQALLLLIVQTGFVTDVHWNHSIYAHFQSSTHFCEISVHAQLTVTAE